MAVTTKDREFLTAVAQDKLPRYDSLGVLHRAANRLIRAGLLEESRVGEWTRYSLTPAGSAELAGTPEDSADAYRERGEDPVDRATCEHGGLLLTEDPDVYDCTEGCGDECE